MGKDCINSSSKWGVYLNYFLGGRIEYHEMFLCSEIHASTVLKVDSGDFGVIFLLLLTAIC